MEKKIYFLIILVVFNLSGLAQNKIENLKIVWPEEYKWKLGSNQENGNIHLIELIPEKATLEKWSIMGTMMSIKGLKNVSVEVIMNTLLEQAKKNAPETSLTLLEKNLDAKNPWILFKIEAPEFLNDKKPESQLYYIIQGESSLYSNFVSVKEKKLSKDFVEKWRKVFKESELVYQ